MRTAIYLAMRAAGYTASEHSKRAVHMNAEIYVRCGGPFGACMGRVR